MTMEGVKEDGNYRKLIARVIEMFLKIFHEKKYFEFYIGVTPPSLQTLPLYVFVITEYARGQFSLVVVISVYVLVGVLVPSELIADYP